MFRGKKYQESMKLIDKQRLYDSDEALSLATQTAKAKFDETVEVHVKLALTPVMPTSRSEARTSCRTVRAKYPCARISKGDKAAEAEAAGAEFVGAEDMVDKIRNENFFDYDVVVAHAGYDGCGRPVSVKSSVPRA